MPYTLGIDKLPPSALPPKQGEVPVVTPLQAAPSLWNRVWFTIGNSQSSSGALVFRTPHVLLGTAVVATAAVLLTRHFRKSGLADLPHQPWHDERWKTLPQSRREPAVKQWYEEAGKSVMDDVGDLVNAMGGEAEAGKALGAGLYRQHRTLQSNFFRALPHMLNEYARRGEQFGTDARNEAAVKMAKKLAICAKDEFLPFI